MINGRRLMAASGLAMAVVGAMLIFLPDEIAKLLAIASDGALPVILQLLGALYLAYGMLNWVAKANPMGGIYGRPIGLANMAHFTIGALVLARYAVSHTALPSVAATTMYIIFAVLFAAVVFGPPPFAKTP